MSRTAYYRADLGKAGTVEVSVPQKIPADEIGDLLAFIDLIKGQIVRRSAARVAEPEDIGLPGSDHHA